MCAVTSSDLSYLYREGVNTSLIRYHAIIAKVAEIYDMASDADGIESDNVSRNVAR